MEKHVRKLASSNYYQSLYQRNKEMNNLFFFDNVRNYSKMQVNFLNWLSIYNSLYTDLAMEEDYLTEDVIKDNIRTDAYLFYRNKKRDKTQVKKKDDEIDASDFLGIPKVVFKSKKKDVK